MTLRAGARLLIAAMGLIQVVACGPVPPPKNVYTNGAEILKDLDARRQGITSFRITGRVDDFGGKYRIQGKTYLFAVLPEKLRIELVSPFGSPLNVMTIDKGQFAIHDLREGKYLTGPAEPCNIAKFVKIPMPPSDVVRILVGHTPMLQGPSEVTWDRKGFYRVTITEGKRKQYLEVGKDRDALPLLRSTLADAEGTVFDITYSRWQRVGDQEMPHEIRVKMPRENAHILLRYDVGGVELNVELPADAWTQSPPEGITPEVVRCE